MAVVERNVGRYHRVALGTVIDTVYQQGLATPIHFVLRADLHPRYGLNINRCLATSSLLS